MKRFPCIMYLTLAAVLSVSVSAQDAITTAVQYFSQVSARYGEITDYEADISIVQGESVMSGKLYYKSPDKLRINFDTPKDQVIAITGDELIIYLPTKDVALTQTLVRGSAGNGGLELFSRGYNFAWVESQQAMPLEAGSNEKVVKLKLTWRSVSEGFREIEMSVNESGYIRRLAGITKDFRNIQVDFRGIRVNQNIPDSRFEYDSPPSSYVMNNFIFPEE